MIKKVILSLLCLIIISLVIFLKQRENFQMYKNIELTEDDKKKIKEFEYEKRKQKKEKMAKRRKILANKYVEKAYSVIKASKEYLKKQKN